MSAASLSPAMWEVLDRMIRAEIRLAWQRGNGRDYPETAWWNHGKYSLYRIPVFATLDALMVRRLIQAAEIGDPPANVWFMRPTPAGERAWEDNRHLGDRPE